MYMNLQILPILILLLLITATRYRLVDLLFTMDARREGNISQTWFCCYHSEMHYNLWWPNSLSSALMRGFRVISNWYSHIWYVFCGYYFVMFVCVFFFLSFFLLTLFICLYLYVYGVVDSVRAYHFRTHYPRTEFVLLPWRRVPMPDC